MKVRDIKNGHKCYCVNNVEGGTFEMVAQRVEPINNNTFRLFMVNPNTFECFNVDVNGEYGAFTYHRVDSFYLGDEVVHYTIFLDRGN